MGRCCFSVKMPVLRPLVLGDSDDDDAMGASSSQVPAPTSPTIYDFLRANAKPEVVVVADDTPRAAADTPFLPRTPPLPTPRTPPRRSVHPLDSHDNAETYQSPSALSESDVWLPIATALADASIGEVYARIDAALDQVGVMWIHTVQKTIHAATPCYKGFTLKKILALEAQQHIYAMATPRFESNRLDVLEDFSGAQRLRQAFSQRGSAAVGIDRKYHQCLDLPTPAAVRINLIAVRLLRPESELDRVGVLDLDLHEPEDLRPQRPASSRLRAQHPASQ